jgi:hypothetical protein
VVTEKETLYVMFRLTEEGKVASFSRFKDYLH